METIIHRPLNIGDWVKGKARNGAFIHGYVEALDDYHATATVKVIDCDHVRAIGRSLKLAQRQLQKLSLTPIDTEGQMLNFIDLALSTKDEAWFHELSDQLRNIKEQAREKEMLNR